MKRRYGFTILAGLVAVVIATRAIAGSDEIGPRYSPTEVVCRVIEGASIADVNATYGTIVRGHLIETDVYLLVIPHGQNPESTAAQINNDPRVEFCRPNYYLAVPEGFQRSSPFVDQELIGTFEDQPAAVTLALPATHDLAIGEGTTIALIDGGVDIAHPVFALAPGDIVSRYDYLEEDSLAQPDSLGSCAAHGTFVAAALQLVAPGADINVYKVLDSAGQGSAFTIAAAVLQAIADSVSVINLSLGMTGIDENLDEALRLARQADIPIVASAGNDSTDLNSIFPFPASRTYAVAVAALDSTNRKAGFSNYGLRIDICAPGTAIYSAYADSLYAWWDGTSFAAPLVTGVIALVRSVNPSLTAVQIDTLLQQSATSIDSLNPGYEGLLGSGLIDPIEALERAYPVAHGDVTADGTIEVSDLTALVGYLFRAGVLNTFANADANCDDRINVADLTILVRYLFFESTLPCMIQ